MVRFPLLILVPSRPLDFQNRKVIRQTWGTDHNMNNSWKPMFLFGQARHPSANKYLGNDAAIQGELVQGSQLDSYHDLTLKVQMDFDFVLLSKAYDDVFINPFTLIVHLRSSQTPKSKLHQGNYPPNENIQEGRGSGRCHTELLPKILLRSSICFISLPRTSFCRGI